MLERQARSLEVTNGCVRLKLRAWEIATLRIELQEKGGGDGM
jgi:hypothetical protein